MCTSDREIRDKLLENLKSDKNNIKVINELDLHGAVIDIAVIDKKYFYGYEIKSDRDTLRRLPIQMQIYGYVLDKITIVVGKSKALKVSGLIPKFWGLIVAKNELGKIVLIEIREPKLNRNININWLSKKLWRSDIVNILKAKNLYKGRSRYYRDGLLKILMENISLSELRHHIRNVLINRIY
ncbi:MAG: sce7726 family protein [Candidatus Atribacteria bacterium]|nr:sce7726 family protein [Candidatus Atribacteria bacterium]